MKRRSVSVARTQWCFRRLSRYPETGFCGVRGLDILPFSVGRVVARLYTVRKCARGSGCFRVSSYIYWCGWDLLRERERGFFVVCVYWEEKVLILLRDESSARGVIKERFAIFFFSGKGRVHLHCCDIYIHFVFQKSERYNPLNLKLSQ